MLIGGIYSTQPATLARPEKPNFIVILCVDLGYGDVGPFDSKVNQTPHLDRMAEEGLRLERFPQTAASRWALRVSPMIGHTSESFTGNIFPILAIFPKQTTAAVVTQD